MNKTGLRKQTHRKWLALRDSAYEERQFIVAEVDGDDFLPVADRAGRVRRFKTRVKAIALADKLNLAIHAVAGVDKQL